MLVRWADGTNDSSPKHLTFQVFFFINSYRLRALKTLYFHFCNFIKKINWKGFCKEFCKILWKQNNTWNINRLADESFVPSAQQTSVLYCRLTDFKCSPNLPMCTVLSRHQSRCRWSRSAIGTPFSHFSLFLFSN